MSNNGEDLLSNSAVPLEVAAKPKSPRPLISKQLQVRIFRRDCWLCQWCGRPVIFAPAMRYLEQLLRQSGFAAPLAYHDPRWRRDRAPLLDHLGAVIDHIEPYSRGGASDEQNFVTSCNKCNMRKNVSLPQEYAVKSPLHKVRGKYGEPQHWDGLSTLFMLLIEQSTGPISPSEREWRDALRESSSPLPSSDN